MLLVGCGSDSGGGGSASTAAGSSAAVSSASSGPTSTTIAPAPALPQAPANLNTGPALVFDPASPDFFDQPFPLPTRLVPNGGPDLSGLQNPRRLGFIRKIHELAQTGTDGFSPTGAIYFRFDAPLNAVADDPVASVNAPGYPVLLVDVDPTSPARLTRHPVHVAITRAPDSSRPANLLQVLPVPGRGLAPNRTYAALVLRSVGAPGAAFLGQHPLLTDLLAGRQPAGAAGAALAQAFAPLPSALQDLGIHPQDVAAATVFTTCDPTESLIRQAKWARALPPPPLAGPLQQRGQFPTFTALKSATYLPQYQNGVVPYVLGGGSQVQDATGMPVRQADAHAEFQLSIPKGPMPAKGYPLYFYCHGTGGTPDQAIDRGRFTAPKVLPPLGSGLASIVGPEGWATACVAGPFSPARISLLAADGYLAYNFLNPIAMRDNFAQMILEQIQFLNLLLSLRIDPSLCPGSDASAAPDGKIRFDPDTLVVGGQSLGSYLSGMLAAVLPDFKGAVLTGAGGSWVEFAFGPVDPIDLKNTLEILALAPGEKLDRFHPLIMAFDLGVGPADNTHYVRHVLREPLPGHTPPHVLVVEGDRDLQVATNLQRSLILAMGVDFVGSDPGPTPDDQVVPVLPFGGLNRLSYPVQGNRTYGGLTRTAVVVRYQEDGIREGHHVWMQRDEPRRQIAEFVSAIQAGTIPEVRQ